MSDAVTLLVPVDATYRVLAPEVARKYLEISGGSSSDADALSASLTAALATLADAANRDAGVTLELTVEAGSVEVRLRCGDRSLVVTQPVPARKSS
jgi:hypothetical protein